jgi:hypothetical protein
VELPQPSDCDDPRDWFSTDLYEHLEEIALVQFLKSPPVPIFEGLESPAVPDSQRFMDQAQRDAHVFK